MEEYFRLFGMDCPPEVRRRLDRALHVLPDSTPERYAQLLPDWQGRCPMQREDGLCSFQVECGEDAIPEVCRTYPRGVRTAFETECSCSNSCEKTLELLFARIDPLRFITMEFARELPMTQQPEELEKARRDKEIQRAFIEILQDRRYSLPQRLARLGYSVKNAENSAEWAAGSPAAAIETALAGWSADRMNPADGGEGLGMQCQLLLRLAKDSFSLSEFLPEILQNLSVDPDCPPEQAATPQALAAYEAAAAAFAEEFPQWEVYFEHMLVNLMFFDGFPYSIRNLTLWDEYAGLCAAYACVRFLAIGWHKTHTGMESFVDVCAAANRLIAHSNFAWNGPVVLHRTNNLTEERLQILAQM